MSWQGPKGFEVTNSTKMLLILLFFSRSSLSVSEGAYNCNWCDGSQEFKQLVCIVIVRSQKHQRILALKYIEVSLKSYEWVNFIFICIKSQFIIQLIILRLWGKHMLIILCWLPFTVSKVGLYIEIIYVDARLHHFHLIFFDDPEHQRRKNYIN